MDETAGEQSPSTPSPSPSTNSQLELVHGQDAEVPFKSSDLTESDLRSENLSDDTEDILVMKYSFLNQVQTTLYML